MSSDEVQKPPEEINIDEKKEEDKQLPPEEKDLNYKELFFMHPSQKDKKKKDFTEYTRVDMSLLNKKRERKDENGESDENNNKYNEDKNVNEQNEDDINEKKEEEINEKNEDMKDTKNEEQNIETNNNNKDEEVKENDLEKNLPKELLELIEERKGKEPFTAADFEKYKVFKKLDINFSK